MAHRLFALSPLDGRYQKAMGHLPVFFSEAGLMQYRLRIEVEYLIALGAWKVIRELKPFSPRLSERMRRIYSEFGIRHAEKVKDIEQETRHDVKAVEYYLRGELKALSLFPEHALEFVHFACTSEDINNLAYAMMIRDALKKEYLPRVQSLLSFLKRLSIRWKGVPMLGMTHGQPASPTTVGKEILVFVRRLERQIETVKSVRILGKFGGATGTWGAHLAAYPDADWLSFSRKFIRSFGLTPNLVTTQIESHDWEAELFDAMKRVNTVLLGLSRDCWFYISRGIFRQKVADGEVGSSTMPHKVNPIDFENAEGNIDLANALLMRLSERLPVSRMQRDLSDSTVQRSIGTAFGYCVLALHSLWKGLNKVTLDREHLADELDGHWEVLGEAVQTVLRRYGVKKGYEQLKALTRGKTLTQESYRKFVEGLGLPVHVKNELKSLTPQDYIGLAKKL